MCFGKEKFNANTWCKTSAKSIKFSSLWKVPFQPFLWKMYVPLFVFLIGGLKQNVKSFWTHVSHTVFYALSHGSLGFTPHGSFFNHFLIGWFSSTANKILWNKPLMRLPLRTKCRLPCERKSIRHMCQSWVYILFEATHQKNKQRTKYYWLKTLKKATILIE